MPRRILWPRWKRRFEQFSVASGLAAEAAVKQVSTLLYCMGEEAEEVLLSTRINEAERKVYATVLEKLDSYFKVRKNVIFERARFNRRHQQDGESAEQYIMELFKLVEHCEYGALRDQMVRDRIVVGIKDSSLSEQLQLNANLTLDSAMKRVRQREAVHETQQVLKGKESTSAETSLDDVRKSKPKTPNKQLRSGSKYLHYSNKTRSSSRNKSSPHQCTRCGKEPHPRDSCPAKVAICLKCKKRGHYSSQCFSNISELSISHLDSTNRSEVEKSNELCDTSFDTNFLDAITNKDENCWKATLQVDGKDVAFKVDTGAEVTAISEPTFQNFRKRTLSPSDKILSGPSQYPLHVKGCFQAQLRFKSRIVPQQMYVVKGLKNNLLGLPAITALGMLSRLYAISDLKTAIIEKFPSLFSGLGCFKERYEIKLKDGAVPHCLFTPRHVPIPLRQEVLQELQRMEKSGVISRVDQPTHWCSGMVVVPKKKQGTLRICVDLKPLNESVLREILPLPKVEDLLAQMSDAKVFSKLDANAGFWQIPLAEKSRLLTTFITPFGRFCFNKLPFSITSAPEFFQKQMSRTLDGLEGVLCLIDDILVFGKDECEHQERLITVLQRIKKAGITLNKEKCEIGKTELKFLGHVIDQNGIKADPEKVQAIQEMRPPENVSDLRRFIGMMNQLGKFHQNCLNFPSHSENCFRVSVSGFGVPLKTQHFHPLKLSFLNQLLSYSMILQRKLRFQQMPLHMVWVQY